MRVRRSWHVRRPLVERLEPRIALAADLGAVSVPGRYIVVLDNSVAHLGEVAQQVAARYGGRPGHVYEHALKGFSTTLSLAAAEAMKGHPLVKSVEPDLTFRVTAQTLPTGVNRIDTDLNPVANLNGLDERIDVDIAILDTGIDGSHPDLNVYSDGSRSFVAAETAWQDVHGHGTHAAGIAAALDNGVGVVGVAPGARLWALKVIDSTGYGSISDALAAGDYLTAHADEIEVANMSFIEAGQSPAFHQAVRNAVAAGVVIVAGAGNNSQDIYGADRIYGTSDDYFPASYPEVLTVSAMTDYDGRPGGSGGSSWDRLLYGPDDAFASLYSNYSTSVADWDGDPSTPNPVTSPGAGIDLIMPGTRIYTTEKLGGYVIADGTSMASPHAAGLAALFIAEYSLGAPGDINGDGVRNAADVYALRQSLINRGKDQVDTTYGLKNGGDPDNNRERIGWAGPVASSPPVTGADIGTTQANTSVRLNLLSNDSDPDGNSLWVSIGSQPLNGAAVVNPDRTITYTPASGFVGSDSFTYAAHDGVAAGNVVTVTVTVQPPGTIPPSVAVRSPNGGEDWQAGSTRTITWDASDDEGVISVDLYYSTAGAAGPFSLITSGEPNDGSYSWVVPNVYTTAASVKVVVRDAAGNVAEDTSDAVFTISPPADTTAPAPPTGLVASAGIQRVALDWGDNAETDLAGYNIYRRASSGGVFAEIATVTASEYTDTGLTGGTTYDYYVSAVDRSANESAPSGVVSATAKAVATTMHVGDLDGATAKSGTSWRARVTITVLDANGSPVSNATVVGNWSSGSSGTSTATTNAQGLAVVESKLMKGSVSRVNFTVSKLTHGSLTYDGAANIDPDGDSNGTSITIYKVAPTAAPLIAQSIDPGMGEPSRLAGAFQATPSFTSVPPRLEGQIVDMILPLEETPFRNKKKFSLLSLV